MVIKALKFPLKFSFWGIDHIVQDILFLVPVNKSLSFSHICRKANSAAHWLAKQARVLKLPQNWLSSIPRALSLICEADRTPRGVGFCCFLLLFLSFGLFSVLPLKKKSKNSQPLEALSTLVPLLCSYSISSQNIQV